MWLAIILFIYSFVYAYLYYQRLSVVREFNEL